jgi:tetratricopeptide (TPR) repeat protein
MDSENNKNSNIEALIERYEIAKYNKQPEYFSEGDFCSVIDYYLANGKYPEALKAIKQAEKTYPEQQCVYAIFKTKVYITTEQYDKALKTVEKLEGQITDDESSVYFLKGIIYLESNESEKAIKALNCAFDRRSAPLTEESELSRIPNMLIDNEYYKEALAFIKKINKEYPEMDYMLETAICYYKLGQTKKAEKYFEQLMNNRPLDPDLWTLLGTLRLEDENFKDAVEAFDFATSIDGANHTALYNKGLSLMRLGKYDESLDILLSLNQSDINSASLSIAMCYEFRQDWAEAEKYYSKAIEYGDNLALAYWGLARAFCRQDNFESSIRALDSALELEPENETFRQARGLVLSMLALKNPIAHDDITQNEKLTDL